MATILWKPATEAVMITAFVATMMITVEYVSVLSRGGLQKALMGSRWIQYPAAVLLGALPGCLGPFTVVTLYAHRLVPFGAVVGAMIATSGDEAFVMFTLFPLTALWFTLGLAAVGLVAGPLVDLVFGGRLVGGPCPDLTVHEEEVCRCFPGREIVNQWRPPGRARLALFAAIVLCVAAVGTGLLGTSEWSWIRVTLVLVGLFGAFIVATVPDHFLREHLWRHVALTHVPRIFGWTLAVLLGIAILRVLVDFEFVVRENLWSVLVVAALLGIIPESGPHLIFVTLFSQGTVPLSILATSSIVQDGHGMLPLLAESRRDFLRIKSVNLVAGLAIGTLLFWLGF